MLQPHLIDRIRDEFVKGHDKLPGNCPGPLDEGYPLGRGSPVVIPIACYACNRRAEFQLSRRAAVHAGLLMEDE